MAGAIAAGVFTETFVVTQVTSAHAVVAAVKARAGTYTGSLVNTLWGTVQVKAVINSAGKISDVIAVKLTDRGRRSVSISSQAAPIPLSLIHI